MEIVQIVIMAMAGLGGLLIIVGQIIRWTNERRKK